MTLEFAMEKKFTDFVEIDDVGNCSLIGFDDFYNEFIAVTDTYQGQTRILIAGPITPDVEILPSETQVSFQQMQYSEKKIQKALSGFARNLVQLQAVDKETALGDMRDLVGYMKLPIY